jgi:hypothetical protein
MNPLLWAYVFGTGIGLTIIGFCWFMYWWERVEEEEEKPGEGFTYMGKDLTKLTVREFAGMIRQQAREHNMLVEENKKLKNMIRGAKYE